MRYQFKRLLHINIGRAMNYETTFHVLGKGSCFYMKNIAIGDSLYDIRNGSVYGKWSL